MLSYSVCYCDKQLVSDVPGTIPHIVYDSDAMDSPKIDIIFN